MEKDPRAGAALLELLGRQHPETLGRKQVVKLEQDKVTKIMFVEKDGDEWQRGQARTASHEQPALPSGDPPSSPIIVSEDDNDF